MANLFLNLERIVMVQAVRYAARHIAPLWRVKTITIRCEGDHLVVEAQAVYQQDAETRSRTTLPFAICVDECPLKLVHAAIEGANGRRMSIDRVKHPAMIFELDPAFGPELIVTVECEWYYRRPNYAGNPMVVVPEQVPLVVSNSYRAFGGQVGWRPPIRVLGIAEDVSGLDFLGINTDGSGNLIQGVVSNAGRLRPVSAEGTFVLSQEIRDRIPASSLATAQAIADAAARFYAETLQSQPPPVRVTVLDSEMPLVWEGVRGLTEYVHESYWTFGAVNNVLRWKLAYLVAGFWWGGACQVVGPAWREMEDGLRLGMAIGWLTWARYIDDPAEVEQTVDQLIRPSALRDMWAPLMNGRREGLTTGYAMRFARALAHESGWERLRALTTKSWGDYLPSDELESVML